MVRSLGWTLRRRKLGLCLRGLGMNGPSTRCMEHQVALHMSPYRPASMVFSCGDVRGSSLMVPYHFCLLMMFLFLYPSYCFFSEKRNFFVCGGTPLSRWCWLPSRQRSLDFGWKFCRHWHPTPPGKFLCVPPKSPPILVALPGAWRNFCLGVFSW